jgi:hypothetical protein
MERRSPSRSQTSMQAAEVYSADSTGRRNTLTVRSCDGSAETAVSHGGPVTDALTWSATGGAA